MSRLKGQNNEKQYTSFTHGLNSIQSLDSITPMKSYGVYSFCAFETIFSLGKDDIIFVSIDPILNVKESLKLKQNYCKTFTSELS